MGQTPHIAEQDRYIKKLSYGCRKILSIGSVEGLGTPSLYIRQENT